MGTSNTRRGFAVLTVFVLTLAAVIWGAILLQGYVVAVSSSPRGLAGDFWADVILGQPDFSEVNPGPNVGDKLWLPHGVIVDRTNDVFYIFDAGNNRVLGFYLSNCNANNRPCSADLIIGQPSVATTACNGDSGFQNYPVRAPASASSMCGLIEGTLSIAEGGSGSSMAVDGNGNLYITDYWNHRVLKYEQPFAMDTIADDVWGQDDFVGNACNGAQPSPSDSSLCFSWGTTNNWTAGVDVDPDGNLWVVDSDNNRVLRFPPGQPIGAKHADLVLGQSDFTSKTQGTGINQFADPNAVRVSPSTGWVYVSEHKNDRVMVFKPPFSSGMSAHIVKTGFNRPAGIDFDPTEPDKVWIMNEGNRTLELWSYDLSGDTKKIGRDGVAGFLGDATGSVGIDSSGNIMIAMGLGDYTNDVLLFQKKSDGTYETELRLFNMHLPNVTDRDLGFSVPGVEIAGNQLIVADFGRILFWNDPSPDMANHQPANGYVSGFSSIVIDGFEDRDRRCCAAIAASDNHLYVSTNRRSDDPFRILVYELPLREPADTNKSPNMPVTEIPFPLDLADGAIDAINNDSAMHGIVPTADDSFLWVTQPVNNRAFRIKIPLTDPIVDVILGQTSVDGTSCNQGGTKTASTLCKPGSLAYDRHGNLYVSDHSLEIQGNFRLLEFDAGLFPIDTGNSVIYGPEASKIFPQQATWEPAFDSGNQMVVGYNTWYGANPKPADDPSKNQVGWFPGFYIDPLAASTDPNFFLEDYYSEAISADFDQYDNLYIVDLNRGRVLVYKPFCGADTDGDSWTDCQEAFITTDPLVACLNNGWPPDPSPQPDGNGTVGIDDVFFAAGRFNQGDGDPNYTRRAEIASQDGIIGIDDGFGFAGRFNQSS